MVISFDHHVFAVPRYAGHVRGSAVFKNLSSVHQRIYLFYEYINNDVLLETGGIPVLGNIVFKGTGFLRGDSFGSEFLNQNEIQGFSSNAELAFDLFFLNLKMEADLIYTGTDPDISGGHTLLLPAHFRYFSVSDSYIERNSGDTKNISRINKISITIPSFLSLSGETGAVSYEKKLVQNWKGAINSGWTPPFNLKILGSLENVSTGFTAGTNGYFTKLNISFGLNFHYENEDEVIIFLEKTVNHDHIFSCGLPRKSTKNPPIPFTTSRIQQVANN